MSPPSRWYANHFLKLPLPHIFLPLPDTITGTPLTLKENLKPFVVGNQDLPLSLLSMPLPYRQECTSEFLMQREFGGNGYLDKRISS